MSLGCEGAAANWREGDGTKRKSRDGEGMQGEGRMASPGDQRNMSFVLCGVLCVCFLGRNGEAPEEKTKRELV